MSNILVVDDSSTQRLAWVMQFTKCAQSKPKTAKNGLEALRMLTAEHFDILVTDVEMPEMDGLELVDKVRQFNKDIFIIVSSSVSQTELHNRFKKYGGVYVFNKNERDSAVFSVFQKVRMHCPTFDKCKGPCKDKK